jgi:hypothetical protein
MGAWGEGTEDGSVFHGNVQGLKRLKQQGSLKSLVVIGLAGQDAAAADIGAVLEVPAGFSRGSALKILVLRRFVWNS